MQFALLYRIGIFARNCEMRIKASRHHGCSANSKNIFNVYFRNLPFLSFCLCSITISIFLSLFYHHFYLSVFVLSPFLSFCLCSIAISIFMCLFYRHFYLSVFVQLPFLSLYLCSITISIFQQLLHRPLSFYHITPPLSQFIFSFFQPFNVLPTFDSMIFCCSNIVFYFFVFHFLEYLGTLFIDIFPTYFFPLPKIHISPDSFFCIKVSFLVRLFKAKCSEPILSFKAFQVLRFRDRLLQERSKYEISTNFHLWASSFLNEI